MPRIPKRQPDQPKRRRRAPGKTLEARERQMVRLAVDLAEQQLMDGTASSQVITHYLKLGTTRERLEKERIKEENKLLKAKTESIKSEAKREELMQNAIRAFRKYSGQDDDRDEDDEGSND